MKSKLKKLIKAAVFSVSALLVLLVVVYCLLRSERVVTKFVLPKLSESIGIPITVTTVDLDLLKGVTFTGLVIGQSEKPIAIIKKGSLLYQPLLLFRKTVSITELELVGAELGLVSSKSGGLQLKNAPKTQSPDSKDLAAREEKGTSSSSIEFQIRSAVIKKSELTFVVEAAAPFESGSSWTIKDISIATNKLARNSSPRIVLGADVSGAQSNAAPNISEGKLNLEANLKLREWELGEQLSFAGKLSSLKVLAAGFVIDNGEVKVNSKVTLPDTTSQRALVISGTADVTKLRKVEIAPVAEGAPGAQQTFEIAAKYNISHSERTTVVSDTDVRIVSENTVLGDIALDAEVFLREPAKKSTLKLSSKRLMVDQLQSLLVGEPSDANPSDDPASRREATEAEGQDRASENDLFQNIPQLKTLWLEGQIDLALVESRRNKIEAFHSPFTLRNGELTVKQSRFLVNGNKVAWHGALNFGTLVHTFELSVPKLLLESFPAEVAKDGAQPLRGEITNLLFKSAGRGLSSEAVLDSLDATLLAELREFEVGTSLSDVPPFNILFLPFSVLGQITDFIPLEALPKAITDLARFTKGKLSDSEAITVRDGVLQAKYSKQILEVEKARFNMKFLPSIDLPGTFNTNGNIEINSGVSLLENKLPLPITGTLGRPLPDAKTFAIELLKTVGLMPVNLLKAGAGMVGELDPRKIMGAGTGDKSAEIAGSEKAGSSAGPPSVPTIAGASFIRESLF